MALGVPESYSTLAFSPTPLGRLPSGRASDSLIHGAGVGGHATIHPLRSAGTTTRRLRHGVVPPGGAATASQLSWNRSAGYRDSGLAGDACLAVKPARDLSDHAGDDTGGGPLPVCRSSADRTLEPETGPAASSPYPLLRGRGGKGEGGPQGWLR